MIQSPYTFPESAKFGRAVPKSKIYDHATPSNKVKELFVQEVEKIVWSYKLSPTTINLPAGDTVREIQIFTLILRTWECSREVLLTIDKAIPSPILFELRHGGKIKYAAAYKRPNEADKNKRTISGYFLSDWMKADTPASELPVVLNMNTLYQSLLTSLSPLPRKQSETLDGLVSRVELLRVKEREADKLESRIKKEKQFNHRVELNRILNTLKIDIEGLKQ